MAKSRNFAIEQPSFSQLDCRDAVLSPIGFPDVDEDTLGENLSARLRHLNLLYLVRLKALQAEMVQEWLHPTLTANTISEDADDIDLDENGLGDLWHS